MSFSFRKRTSEKIIPGTKTSLFNGQKITSSGNPSLDHILGGGLPIGSIILIEEDKYVTHSKVLTKYFLAEGIFSKQSIFFVSLEDDPDEFIKKLPSIVQSTDETKNLPPVDDLRIAWRYNELPQINSEQSSLLIGHNYNLSEKIDDEILKNADINYWKFNDADVNEQKIFINPKYFDLLNRLRSIVECEKFSTNETSEDKSILRICISSLGSPLWYDDNFETDFIKFLTILKAFVRNYSTVCFLTIPMMILKILDKTLIPKIRNLVDFSFELESFAGSDKETNPIFKEYSGIFHIRKLSAVNSLAVYCPETTDLAFKLRRKKFIIEKLHLPPELQESDNSHVASVTCSSGTGNNLLDF